MMGVGEDVRMIDVRMMKRDDEIGGVWGGVSGGRRGGGREALQPGWENPVRVISLSFAN